jgi:hypothetical protein
MRDGAVKLLSLWQNGGFFALDEADDGSGDMDLVKAEHHHISFG